MLKSEGWCHVKEMISSFFIFIYTQAMLFKQGDVVAKVGKKTELYKAFHLFINDTLPFIK